MKYRIINLSHNKVITYRSAEKVSVYLLGRRLSNHLIIKSDLKDTQFKICKLELSDIRKIETELEGVNIYE